MAFHGERWRQVYKIQQKENGVQIGLRAKKTQIKQDKWELFFLFRFCFLFPTALAALEKDFLFLSYNKEGKKGRKMFLKWKSEWKKKSFFTESRRFWPKNCSTTDAADGKLQ